MMEILQTIWMALTTENEVLITIITAPLAFIEVYISMLLFTTILNITTNKKERILYIVFAGILSIITRYIIPSPYNTYINILGIFALIKIIFHNNIIKSLLSLVIPFVITIILELFVSKIYAIMFSLDYAAGVNIPINRLIVSLTIYLIEYLTYLVIRHFKISFAKLEITNKKTKFLFIFTNVMGIILISSQLYVLIFYSYSMPMLITLISIISLIVYFAINLYTMFTVSKLETTSMNLEEAQLYNKTLEILQDNTRAFRHDFSNILQGMVGYMDNNDMDGLRKYYSQLVDDIQQSNNLTTLSPKVVNNPAIYNVLATKYHKADSLGIKIHLEAFLDMNDLHMKIYEFTRVLGILMDNAIEATSECENKIINVSFRIDKRKHMQLLVIENTYKNKDVDTDKIFEKGYSTKKGNTGLGLWEVRQILKKNNNLNLFTTKNSEFFTQQFEIFY